MAVKQITLFQTSDEDERRRIEKLVRDEVDLMSGLNHR